MAQAKRAGASLTKLAPAPVGLPDGLLLRPGGRVDFIELKRPRTGRAKAIQLYQHRRLRKLGFRVTIVRSRADLQTVLDTVSHGP